eukprot:TRINITY_DN208_c0_g1_i6.p1 TRINITY_DN208_c0_g1~~TRINITY_DN208_c0_g1_i6.p1  ORF type:complete len:866 (+),score=286.92 TRINITY_DN208_c0_g1_i6:68-2665(+)
MLQQQQQQQQHAATSAARRVKCAQCGASALCTEHALCSCAFAPICESCLCGQQQQQQQQQQKGKQESVEAARVSRFVAGPLTTLARGIEALLRNTEGQKDLEKATDDIKKQFGEMFDEMLSAEWDKFNAEREMQVRAKHKIQVVEELVATEVDYLADLRLLVGWWQVELVKANLLTSEEICIIFGNIAEMVLLSGELLEELKRCKEAPSVKQLIGAAFLKRIPFFKLYTEYTAGRDDATEIIIDAKRNHKFVTLHDKLRAMPQTKGLGLDDYLIKPAQRIMKYPLLLRDLMKDTPADHPDSKNLMKACQEMEEVLAKINTETKRRQTARVVQTLQPNLIWRKEGYDLTASQSHLVFTGPLNTTVVWVGSESNVQGDEVFLFDMCVLVCRVRLGKWEELATFAIKEIQICDVAEGDSADFTIKSARQDCYAVFHPVDKNEQRLWLFHFQEALKEAQSQKKTLVMLDAAAQQQRLEQQILEQQQVAQSDKHTPTHPLRRAGTSSKLIQQAKQAQPQLTREASTSRIPLTYKENSKDLQRGDSPRDIAPPPKDGKEATTPELVSAAPPATVAPVPTSPMPAASPTPKVEKKDKKKEEKEKKEKDEKDKKEKEEKEEKDKKEKEKKEKDALFNLPAMVSIEEGGTWMGMCSYASTKEHFPFQLYIDRTSGGAENNVEGRIKWPTLNNAETRIRGLNKDASFEFDEYEAISGADDVDVPHKYFGKITGTAIIGRIGDESDDVSFSLMLSDPPKPKPFVKALSVLESGSEWRGVCTQELPFTLKVDSADADGTALTGIITWGVSNSQTKFKGQRDKDTLTIVEIEVPQPYVYTGQVPADAGRGTADVKGKCATAAGLAFGSFVLSLTGARK